MDKKELDLKITDAAKSILSYCISRTPDRAEAEDLAQDILLEICRSAANIRDDKAFYGFMWGVASNVYRQWCKKRSGRDEGELTEDISVETEFFAEEDTDLYLLRRELSLLAEKYRKATILYYIDGKSCSEISETLAVSESMVKYLLFKSRQILKEGINMERKLGNLSYNPKSFTPLYHGSGPNRWWEFMGGKIRQNIALACYNDSLTSEQISLETGIPLPYLDDEINALVEKNILLKDGTHYRTNVIIITKECFDETERALVEYHGKIADSVILFIGEYYEKFKAIGFEGCDFSENTLRWQLLAMILRQIVYIGSGNHSDIPESPWGGNAYFWLTESSANDRYLFNYCTCNDNVGDQIHFLDYLPKIKGDHHDFFGDQKRSVNIVCDIVRGETSKFSEYDLEFISELIRKGYVLKTENGYKLAMPVFTVSRYEAVLADISEFIDKEISPIIREIGHVSAKILKAHTPKHLQKQVAGIVSVSGFVDTVCEPANILLEKGFIHTDWNAVEMPTTCVVLG